MPPAAMAPWLVSLWPKTSPLSGRAPTTNETAGYRVGQRPSGSAHDMPDGNRHSASQTMRGPQVGAIRGDDGIAFVELPNRARRNQRGCCDHPTKHADAPPFTTTPRRGFAAPGFPHLPPPDQTPRLTALGDTRVTR